MPASLYSMSPLVVNVGATDIVLPVENIGFSLDILQIIHSHSGNNAPTAILVPGSNPRMQCHIPWLIAQATFGFGVPKVVKLDLILCKYIDFVRGGTGLHPKFSLTTSCFCASQIISWTVNVDGVLMAVVEFVYLAVASLGNPITFVNTGFDPPVFSGSPVLHTLGPVSIAGTIVPGLTSSAGSMNPNLQVMRGLDGDLYPRVAARLQIAPSFHYNHTDPTAIIQAVGLLGVSATVISYFRQYDVTNGITSNTGGISLSMTGRLHPSGVDVQNGAVASTDLTMTGISADGVASPMTVATNVTIPAVP